VADLARRYHTFANTAVDMTLPWATLCSDTSTCTGRSPRADPFSGVIFCFRAKRADRVKLIFWDGTGLCLFAKRLEGGKFRWPRIEDCVMRLSAARPQEAGQTGGTTTGRT
jgi:hypothetical protein